MRESPQGRSAGECISFAEQLGRTKAKRGAEPNYIRVGVPALAPPLSIPNHPGDMRIGTLRSIVDQLLDDCDEWELFLQSQSESES